MSVEISGDMISLQLSMTKWDTVIALRLESTQEIEDGILTTDTILNE